MSTNNEQQEYKVVKNFVGNDEYFALQQVCQKHGKLPYLLEAKHTERCFVWVDKQQPQ